MDADPKGPTMVGPAHCGLRRQDETLTICPHANIDLPLSYARSGEDVAFALQGKRPARDDCQVIGAQLPRCDNPPVREAEYASTGELIVEAYRTLGDEGDEFYEQELRDVRGRVAVSEVLVAEMEGEVVGCVSLSLGQTALSEVEDPDAATIRMFAVSSEARGRGVGEALVRHCLEQACSNRCRRVRLDTRTSMKGAQRIYERLGFRRAPEHDWSPAAGILLLAYVLDF
jgi:ribosomal protein S18 acetylase RimI-like enzyme